MEPSNSLGHISPESTRTEYLFVFSVPLVKQERQDQRLSEEIFELATLHIKMEVSKAVQKKMISD